jgi:hypothetical protein
MHREKSLTLAFAVVALVGTGLVGGCSSKTNDAQLVTNIQSQMFADAQLKSANLQVAAIDGQVTLKGTVPSDAARYEAYKLATQTAGVKKVNDQMVIEDQGAQASADANPPPASDAAAPSAAPVPTPAPSVAPPPARRADLPKPHVAHHAKVDDSGEQYAQMPPDSNTALPAATDQSSSMPPADQAPPPAPAPVAPPPAPVAPAPPPPPPPKQYVVPAATTVSIRMIDSVDSSVNQPGEVFQASLDAPIVVGNDVVVPKGANIYVRLTSASSAGKMTGQSELRLELVKLEYQGGSFPLVSTTYSEQGKSRTSDTEKKVGGGAILGAIIGAVAGGGKGAAIGAAAGAGAGGVYQGATHGQQVKIPSETKLDFQLDQPATITVKPSSQPTPVANDSQPTD